jgi:CubicO group peptidase (beta-lactamase class C family)
MPRLRTSFQSSPSRTAAAASPAVSLRGDPGRRARYSNLGYLALGELIQAVSGAPYVEYVRVQLLEPLGMTSTDFVYREEMAHRAATGGLIGSVSDAARFLDLHLHPVAHPDVLSEQAVSVMQQATSRGGKLDRACRWSAPLQVSSMEVSSERDQRNVDRGQVVGEPPRQVDVRDGAALGAEALCDIGEGAAEPVRREDRGLACHYAGCDRGATIGPPCEPRP